MLTSEGTATHRRAVPSDDRPGYLRKDNNMGYMLAVDTETDGTAWWDGARPFIATASDYDRDYLYRLNDPQDVRALAMAIMSADELVFHNAQFDVHMLVVANILSLEEILSIPIWDTYVIAKVTLGEGNMTGSHLGKFGLKELAAHFVDGNALEPEKVMKQRMKDHGLITRADQKNLPDGVYHELWKIEPDVIEKYALMDTRYTYDLFQVLMEKHRNESDAKKRIGHERALVIEHQVLPEIIRMEHRGAALDPVVVDDLHATYRSDLETFETDLALLAADIDLESFNPSATKDVVALLEGHGVVITEVTEHGQIRTDKKTLEAYKGNEAVDLVLAYRRTSKFLSTLLDPLKDRTVVHTSINPVGAWTHRMSSRRPNLQNVPVRDAESGKLRSMFVPRDGYCFIVADYDRIEPTILAWYMDDMELMRQFQEEDPYALMGAEYHGHDDQSKWRIKRDKFKNGFLSVNYASGVQKLADTLGVTYDEAEKLRDSILTILGPGYSNPWYPPIELDNGKLDWSLGRKYEGLSDGFVQRARKRIKGKNAVGYVQNLAGATFRLDTEDHYKAPNTIIQSGAAYVMKVGTVRAGPAVREFGGHLILPVHDELIAEVPLGIEHDALEAMMDAMKSAEDLALNGKLKLAVTGVVCYNSWAEAK